VPNAVVGPGQGEVRIGHPKGGIAVGVDVDDTRVRGVTMSRTARVLFQGAVRYRYVGTLEALR
jgi:2-methylaconitate cis-trans-isomerase PrpF